MFIVKTEPAVETKATLERFGQKFGNIPPHFALLATVNPKRFELFIQEVLYLADHEHIDPDLFAFLRLYIASREGFSYCLAFNTKMLLAKKYSSEALKSIQENFSNLPLNDRHVLLGEKALKAIYNAEEFSVNDVEELQGEGWTEGDIFDAIDHAAFLFKNARVIKAYTR